MRKSYAVLFIACLLHAATIYSQCTGGSLDATITPTTSWQTVTSHSDKFFKFAAVAGNVYTFSYCKCVGGSISYAAELSLDSTGTTYVNGSYGFTNYNSAYCDDANDAPQLTWQCFTSGTYRILTTEQFCSTTAGLTATLAYKMETPSLCYTVASTTYSPDTYNSGTKPSGMKVDDGISKAIKIGFSFCFNGTYYDSLFISSNGYITFIGSCPIVPMDTINEFPNSSYTMETLPFTNTTYTPFIGPGVLFPWIDAYPLGGGNIFYKLYGTSPNRHLTVSFYNVDLFSCNTKKLTSEVQLYETTNNIQIQSLNIPRCAAWVPPGGQGVEGLVDETGFAAVVPPGRNLTTWTASSEAWLFTPSCCSLLPINLASFTCQDEGSAGVRLKWTTSSETNNKYFTVERSTDGMYFYPVAQIPGAGNSTQTINYTCLDSNASNGNNYYRLRQTDYDGGSIVSAITTCSANRMVAGTIYPNPASGSFSVLLPPSSVTETVTIYDMVGRKVLSTDFDPNPSYNTHTINVAGLRGIFILQITGEQTIVKKLVLR